MIKEAWGNLWVRETGPIGLTCRLVGSEFSLRKPVWVVSLTAPLAVVAPTPQVLEGHATRLVLSKTFFCGVTFLSSLISTSVNGLD